MINKLLDVIQIMHGCVWLFMMHISIYYPEFNILYLLPIWYLTYVLSDKCILDMLENNMGKKSEDVNQIYKYTNNLFRFSYLNMLSPNGMMILGFIISVYSLKFHNQKINL